MGLAGLRIFIALISALSLVASGGLAWAPAAPANLGGTDPGVSDSADSLTRTIFDDGLQFASSTPTDNPCAVTSCANRRADGGSWSSRASISSSRATKAPRGVVDDVVGAACSFAGGTLVLMADGTRKPISQVKVGDRVIATEPLTGLQVAREVTHVWVHQDRIVRLSVDGDVIATTEDHPYWNSTDQAWESAETLEAGDALLAADGQAVRVDGLQVAGARQGSAYNLTIQGVHTFHVGSKAVLVHNTCRLPRFDGPKPAYTVNPAHVPGRGLRRGKTPLPDDAADVFRTAVPNSSTSPTAWFGRNEAGQIYRYSMDNVGGAHFSGIAGVGSGTRNLTPYARGRLAGE